MANGTKAFMAYRIDRLITALVAGLLLSPGQALAAKMLADTELQGKSYRSFELIAPVPDFCRKVCEKDSACKGWMFSWPGKKGKRAQCFLYSEVTEKRQDTCCIAGLRATKETPATAKGGDATGSGGDETAQKQTGERAGATARRETAAPPVKPPETTARSNPGPALRTRQAEAAPPAAKTDALKTPGIAAPEEKRAFCESYANAAMWANRRARELGCGFAGGLWGASRDGYFNWCMNNPRQSAKNNTQRRALALRRCERGDVMRHPETRRPSWEGHFPPWPEEEPQTYRPRREDTPRSRGLWRRARFLYSWLKRSGPGPRSTPWRPTLSGKCVLVRACDCPQGNTCRVYPPGSIAIAWPAGCDGPPAYYVCRVRRR